LSRRPGAVDTIARRPRRLLSLTHAPKESPCCPHVARGPPGTTPPEEHWVTEWKIQTRSHRHRTSVVWVGTPAARRHTRHSGRGARVPRRNGAVARATAPAGAARPPPLPRRGARPGRSAPTSVGRPCRRGCPRRGRARRAGGATARGGAARRVPRRAAARAAPPRWRARGVPPAGRRPPLAERASASPSPRCLVPDRCPLCARLCPPLPRPTPRRP